MHDDLRNAAGERLDATWHPPAGGTESETLVVIGHGVTANKDRPFLVALAEGLAAADFGALRFSFAGNGGSEGRFEEATITKEVGDLGSVLDAVAAEDRRIVYVGHSMGAAVGVLRASADERIRALVSLAGMMSTAEFCERKFGALVPGRDVMWEKPECPLSQAFVDDLAAIDSTIEAAANVAVPWLLVHGTADEVVPLADSHAARTCATDAEVVEIEGAGHLFEGEATDRMVATVVEWLGRRSA